MEDKIFIVCGYGTIGIKVCKNLQQNNKSCIIVIDKNPLIVDKIFKDGFIGVKGDASSTRVLLDSSIKSANALICTFADDDLNALCIVSAKWLNPEIYIISRANKFQSVKKFKLAGASKVINFPNLKNKFLKLTNNRFKIDLLVSSLSSFESQFYISEIKASDYSFLHSKQLLEIKNIADIKIMALKKTNEEVISNPSIYEYIDKKDTIVILSEKEMIEYIREKLKILSFYNIISQILNKIFSKKLTFYWITILILFDYFVLFDNFLNWIVLPAPPFTMGHLLFALTSFTFALILIYISMKFDKQNKRNKLIKF